jgi:hypothetical protein
MCTGNLFSDVGLNAPSRCPRNVFIPYVFLLPPTDEQVSKFIPILPDTGVV